MRQALTGIVSKSVSSLLKTSMVASLALTFAVTDVVSAMAAPSSAIVVDAKTGKTLYAKDANARRYPASLTKMMTLYLTFEALAQGRIAKNTPVVFSAKAAAEPPTKLGVRKGGAVTVETAILSMVTKSANDSSTALAEMLGGSEANFARMMTSKARALGMKSTVFRNANGLPDPGQFTTAHDMAVLGMALREHYPQYYGYFSTRSFAYGKRQINGHNRLLGRIKGVDGIKTGYTRASGFNLVSSVADGNRKLVAVVMGGSSGGSRDKQMASLIQTYMPQTSTRGSGPLVARASGDTAVAAIANVFLPKKNAPTPDEKPEILVASADETAAVEVAAEDAVVEPAKPSRKTKKVIAAAAPVTASAAEMAIPAELPVVQAYAPVEETPIDRMMTASTSTNSAASGGWAVQIASAPREADAKAQLDKVAKQAGRVLAKASGFTVAFDKDGTTYYRARFGFETKEAAWKACNALKRKSISCYAVQQ
ncbi:D-alanyl-D-alanine carboxypeptidase [Mesorhizobium sp. NPDC059054]|uniref:D-alanyl-D-alanine carboxypeptidase n=1 Tax=unclassified Mesorhizobium TaxID=325217 RepID=UPI0006C76401|nr:D-alanyl-D-alanine carboxypeptidase [Mesorhizobium sp. 1M-11]